MMTEKLIRLLIDALGFDIEESTEFNEEQYKLDMEFQKKAIRIYGVLPDRMPISRADYRTSKLKLTKKIGKL